jgi:hypothetical protein
MLSFDVVAAQAQRLFESWLEGTLTHVEHR